MTSPTAGDAGEVLEATAAQVQDTIDRLTPEYTLTRKPTRGSFWHELREEVRGAYRAQARGHGSRSGRAIIMAGAPGAGKSQAVATARRALGPQRSKQVGVDESGYTTIDADDIKQLLLGNPVDGLDVNPDLLERARAHWDGLIAEQAPDPLPDGRPISRGELAALVHRLSTDTADLARGDLLAERFDVTIEGTLVGKNKGPRLIRELEAADYTHVVIVAVDTPEKMCLQGARDRWAGPRTRGDPTARYTPTRIVTDTFSTGPDGSKTCRCIDNAQATHHLAAASTTLAGADLLVARRTEHGSALIDHIGRDGTTRAYFAPRQWIAATENPTISTAQKQQFTPADTLRKINAGTQQATRSTPRPRGPEPPGHDHGIGL